MMSDKQSAYVGTHNYHVIRGVEGLPVVLVCYLPRPTCGKTHNGLLPNMRWNSLEFTQMLDGVGYNVSAPLGAIWRQAHRTDVSIA
jgi:hypothetical protein